MKKVFLELMMVLVFISNSLMAQSYDNSSKPIYDFGSDLVDNFEEKGFEIVRIEYDLVFSSKETFRNLSSDWEYTIVGFADKGVKDLDVKLYRYNNTTKKWVLESKDNSEETYAIISVKPEESELYKVEVIVYEFNKGYSAARYGLMFLHK